GGPAMVPASRRGTRSNQVMAATVTTAGSAGGLRSRGLLRHSRAPVTCGTALFGFLRVILQPGGGPRPPRARETRLPLPMGTPHQLGTRLPSLLPAETREKS